MGRCLNMPDNKPITVALLGAGARGERVCDINGDYQ